MITNRVDILLVEDSPGDVRLTQEALKEGRVANRLHVVGDGESALAFMRREGEYLDAPEPALVLLDLNLPRLDGREVLRQMKADALLRRIPVIVLSTSTAEEDVLGVYDLLANCYIAKPVEFGCFAEVVRSIEEFWLTRVVLPTRGLNAV